MSTPREAIVDRATEEFLEAAARNPPPPPESLTIEMFRAAVESYRAQGFPREEVAEVRDLEIPVGVVGGRVPVRLYLPAVDAPPALIVWAHGGSWTRIYVDLIDSHFPVYANRSSCAIAAVDYRLAPEARFPVAVEDVYATAAWLRANGARLGCDPDRIAVAGESTGAGLAAAATLLDRERREVGIAHQTLIIPLLDAALESESWNRLEGRYLLARPPLRWALAQYAPGVAASDPLLSPLREADHRGLPPALVVAAELDPLRDDAERYAAKLRAAGIDVDYRCEKGLIHHAIMVPKAIPRAGALLESVAAEVGRVLRDGARDRRS